ncbi:MAG TPA: hypothetical protein VFP53_02545 [Sphingomicrobium sp.]|nr:hypothetical protein [Sphingomicrobium sp.]
MQRLSPAMRRYTISLTLLMIAYVLILFGVNVYFANSSPTGASAYIAAALPALPIIGVFLIIGRLIVDLKDDEYVRMLMVRQTLIATGFSLTIATVWGFLESFDLAPHVEAYWFAVLWFAGLGIGGCANALIERGGGE